MHLLLISALALTGAVQAREPSNRERARPPERPAQSVYFANCSAARAAGRENIRRGEPGYRPALDRDNDGVACESR